MGWWETFKEWFLNLGDKYGVNPFVFGGIYIGAIPFFFLSLSWTVKNIKKNKAVVFPILLTGFFFISAYLYLLIQGRNIPFWVCIFIVLMIGYGVFDAVKKVQCKTKNS